MGMADMLATYVESKRTPLTFEEACDAMKWALKTRIGSNPTTEVLALALAKTALETGRWKAIWNSNWGNVKAAPTYEGMYTCILLNEVLVRNGVSKLVWFAPEGELSANPAKGGVLVEKPRAVPPGHPQTRMRAFANNYDGVDQYVKFVEGGRYKRAWDALLTGNAPLYIRELKAAKYFTADEAQYLKTTAALQREFVNKINQAAPGETQEQIDWRKLREAVPNLQFDLTDDSDDESDVPNV